MLRDSRTPLNSGTSSRAHRAGRPTDSRHMCWSGAIMGLMFLVCWPAQPGWGYSGGMGSLQAPYLIPRAADLIELGQNPKDYDKHFLLTQDIDLSAYTFTEAVIAASSEGAWHTFFADGDIFSGTINGNGHVIQNLAISGSSNLGLIGIMGPSAQVYGLGIVDANIVGTGENAATLAAYSEGRISGSYSTGSVSGKIQVGGLVGENYGYIADSYSHGMVSGASRVGGLVGRGPFSDIINSYSTCMVSTGSDTDNVESPPMIGGLVGSGSHASNCFWDMQTSGISGTGTGTGTGLNTDQMQTIDTYVEAGWDFQGEVANGCREIWLIPEAGGYPVLSVFGGLASALPADCDAALGPCALPLDANEVLWDSTASFAADWDSVAITRFSRNAAEYPENDPGERDIIITVSGKIEIRDANNLIALDARNSMLCQAIDDQGDGIMLRHVDSPFEPRHCWEILNTSPRPFSLHLQLDPSQAIPTGVSQLDYYVYAFYAQPLTTFDIPFVPMADWMELWPGFRIIIETALSEDGRCEYTIKEEISGLRHSDDMLRQGYDLCDPAEDMWYRSPDDFTERDLIYSRDMIDSLGMPTSRGGGSRSSSSRSRDGVTSRTESGDWSDCSGIERI